MEYIGERVAVVAIFGGTERLSPIKFRWDQRVIKIRDVTYSWMDKEGTSKVYHFSVTDGGTLYELSFNTDSIIWSLEKVETDV